MGAMFTQVYDADPPIVTEQRGPILRQTRKHLNASWITPPTTATPRLVSDPLPAGKFVWILHPCHGDIVVA
jgi:hypothetical protein